MAKRILIGVGLLLATATQGMAQFAVVCTTTSATTGVSGCASESTSTLQQVQLVLTYARQALQLAEQLKQTADMLKNSTKGGGMSFSNMAGEIGQLQTVIQMGQGIAYSAAGNDVRYMAAYPGYKTYAASGGYYGSYKNWARTSLDTMQGVLRAASIGGAQQSGIGGLVSSLRGLLSSADGRQKDLEVVGMLADAQVTSSQQLRSLMLADLSSKQAYQAAMIQKEAGNVATEEQVHAYAGRLTDGKTYGAGWK